MTHAEIDKFLRMLCGHTLGHYETLRATYDIAAALIANGVQGDFVECGVYAGGECAAMALAIMEGKRMWVQDPRGMSTPLWAERRVHLFDSFQGMPQCGPEDSEFLAAGNKPGEACVSLEGVQANMKLWGIPDELLVYHPGWFEDTVPSCSRCVDLGVEPLQIALLRLDGDLYSSTKVCLEHLYPRLVRGGACIVDDYPLAGCRKAVEEVMGEPGAGRKAMHDTVGYPQPFMWHKSV